MFTKHVLTIDYMLATMSYIGTGDTETGKEWVVKCDTGVVSRTTHI